MAQVQSSPRSNSTLPEDMVRRIRESLKTKNVMTLQVAREHRVSEVEVMRLLPSGSVFELDHTRFEDIVRSFEHVGKVHVIASNRGVTLECFGEFGNFSTWGEYFNVQTKSLDMHIRPKEIRYIFAVRKPSHMDGSETLSVQFFDVDGTSAFKVFLSFGGKISEDTRNFFHQLIERHGIRTEP